MILHTVQRQVPFAAERTLANWGLKLNPRPLAFALPLGPSLKGSGQQAMMGDGRPVRNKNKNPMTPKSVIAPRAHTDIAVDKFRK